MKNRIWRRIRKTGIAVATAGAVLSGGFLTETVKSAEIEAVGITIGQSGSWTDKENGRAELNIHVEGIKRWIDERKKQEAEALEVKNMQLEDVTAKIAEVKNMEQNAKEYEEMNFESREEEIEKPEVGETETEWTEEIVNQENTGSGKPEAENTESEIEETENAEQGDAETENTRAEIEVQKTIEQQTSELENMEDQEREEEYEYMEELASGEAVQQENEKSEEAGESTPAGAPSVGEDVEYGENEAAKISNVVLEEKVDGETEEPEKDSKEDSDEVSEAITDETQKKPQIVLPDLALIVYVSEYFQPELSELDENISTSQITIKNQQGKNTEITRIEYKIDADSLNEEQEPISLRIPLLLREEYRCPAENISCHFVQDEPLGKDRNGAGTFLLMKENGEEQVLAEGISPVLDVEAAKADMSLAIASETKKMKAGQTIRYRVDIANTGKLDLTDIQLSSIFSCPKIIQQWENAEGLTAKGAKAQLLTLKAGEKRTLYVLAPLENEQEKPLEHKIEAEASVRGRTGETIMRSASMPSELQPLKADFTVKKNADREKAAPGETVTYQICIVNTGEKTLHSVVGTERFQAEGIEAYFVEQEGITLNRTKTKALIQKIVPGDAVSLQAVVKIPEKTVDQKLLNQVTVTSQETGSRVVEASSQVTVEGNVMAIKSEENIQRTENDQDESEIIYAQGDSMARAATSHPKTGDESGIELFTLLILTAGLTILGGIWLHRKYRELHKEKR